MIILDTDVLSGVIDAGKDQRIIAWLDSQNPSELYTTAITFLEIWQGLEKMSAGKRRDALEKSLHVALTGLLRNRVLPFDIAAAEEAGLLYGHRRRNGITVGQADTQIAGIVLSRGAALATCNTRHFMDLDVLLINPRNE